MKETMVTSIVLAGFILLSFCSCGQEDKLDCEKTLNTTPYFLNPKVEPSSKLQDIDVEILMACANLDTIECDMLNENLLSGIVFELSTYEAEITYHAIVKKFNSFKNLKSYPRYRETFIALRALEAKIVNIEEFEKDREVLVQSRMPPLELVRFEAFILANSSKSMTYKEAMVQFTSEQNSQETAYDVEFAELTDIESALTIGKENGKKTLIYFSCYACINARKVEDRILIDSEVKLLLAENFNYFIAYVDDRTPDKATNRPIGEKFLKLQIEKFNTSNQPNFYILDDNGNVLSEIGYTNDTKGFIDFMMKGLK